MAKTSGIKKTIETLRKKVESLEDLVFARQLFIDELENRLQRAEDTIKRVSENPFNLPVMAPFVQIQPSVPPTLQPQRAQPWVINPMHSCTPVTDTAGNTFCATCGVLMSGLTWLTTSTNTTMCSADLTSQSTSDVEPIIDISWDIPDDIKEKD